VYGLGEHMHSAVRVLLDSEHWLLAERISRAKLCIGPVFFATFFSQTQRHETYVSESKTTKGRRLQSLIGIMRYTTNTFPFT
jgi:hypothetical protein